MFGNDLPADEGERWARLINEHLAQAAKDRAALRAARHRAAAGRRQSGGGAARRACRGIPRRHDRNATERAGAACSTIPRSIRSGRRPTISARIFIHPVFESGDDRVHDYGMANAVGRITDTLIAVSRLIFAGHVARYKNANIIVGIGGAALPYVLGRLRRNHALDKDKLGDPEVALRRCVTTPSCTIPALCASWPISSAPTGS